MTIQISSDGAERILKYMTGVSSSTETLLLKLYSNNITPNSLTSLIEFTEVTGGGYAAKSLSASSWTVTGNSISTTPQLFTFTSGVGEVYGYYLVGQTSNKLIASERFVSGPFNVLNNGDTITVTATISVS